MGAAGCAFRAVMHRELLLGLRHAGELANPLIFFLIIVSLFPLALGDDTGLLRHIAPAIIWVCVLLAMTLSLDRIFESDHRDGTLEQLALSVHPLALLVGAKILAHWLLHGAPLAAAGLALALLHGVEPAAVAALAVTLLLGTPVLSLTGSVLAALTMGLRGGGVLLALLILPLYVPVLIFSSGAVSNARLGLAIAGELYILAALLVLSATLMPLAAAAAVRARLG